MSVLQAFGWAFVVCGPVLFIAAYAYHEGYQHGHAQGLLDSRQEGEE